MSRVEPFVSFLILETDNRTMIIDILGAQISSAVLTTVASRVQLALPDRSLCVEPDDDEGGEEKLKPAHRSRNPAKPADPKFSKANVDQTMTSLMPLLLQLTRAKRSNLPAKDASPRPLLQLPSQDNT